MSSKIGERARGGTSGQAAPRVAASKSRGDKSRTVTVAPLTQVTVDIIPGRFTEDDWLSMVVAEDGEDVVGDIVDSLIGRIMEECLIIHLQHQVIPYTVSQARDAMMQIVQWMFVPRDEEDNELDTEWNSQEEPQPCPHDSWAQGCVPVTLLPHTPRCSQPQVSPLHTITDIPEEEAPCVEEPPGAEEGPPVSSQEPVPAPEPSAPPVQPVIKPTPPTAPPKTRLRYRPHRGPLHSAGLKNITKSLEQTEKEILLEQLVKEEKVADELVDLLPTSLHNILKIQLGRPPQKKDVIYDDAGNVLSVPKVDLSRLPQHHVRPQIEVVDVSRESGKSKKTDVRKRSRHVIKRSREGGIRSHIDSSSCYPPQLQDHTTRTEVIPSHAPPSIFLDTMPLSHGVILREGDTTERGSIYSLRQRKHAKREDRGEIRPIRASIRLPSLSVEQFIKNNIPQVQPLVSFMSR